MCHWLIFGYGNLSGKIEKEFEMILKRTLQNICLLTVHPNTNTSIIVQVVHDDGSVSFPGLFVFSNIWDSAF